jgi:thioesterase domain-containing protein
VLQLSPKDQFAYVWKRLAWHLTVGNLNVVYKLYLRYLRRSPLQLRLLEVAAANTEAAKRYIPETFSGQLTLFRCDVQAVGSDADLELGWGNLATHGVEAHAIPGFHTEMMHEPTVQIVAEKFQACLDQVYTDIEKR